MKMLTPPEVTKLLRITPEKILGWIRSGELRAANVRIAPEGSLTAHNPTLRAWPVEWARIASAEPRQ